MTAVGHDKATSELAQRLEAEVLPHQQVTVERLRILREQEWLDRGAGNRFESVNTNHRRPLVSILVGLAMQHLELRGPTVGLRSDGDPAQRAQKWLWLSRYLPAELAIAALAARAQVSPPHERVQLGSPQLTQLLSERCAETHLHLGAAVSFPRIWTGLVVALSHAVPSKLVNRSPLGADRVPFGSGHRWIATMYGALVARLLFAAFLESREQGEGVSFGKFCSRSGRLYRDICHRLKWSSPDDAFAQVGEMVGTLMQPSSDVSKVPFERFREFYAALCGGAKSLSVFTSLGNLRDADPLQASIPAAPGHAEPEVQLTCRLLMYLDSDAGRDDVELTKLFWQYQRLRSLTYRDLVLAPGVPGLDWFTRIYGHISRHSEAIQRFLVSCALELESQDVCLSALELRQSPSANKHNNRKTIRAIARQRYDYKFPIGAPKPEIGIIFHFIKQREEGGRAHGSPSGLIYPTRHGRWFAKRDREACATADMLLETPEMLLLLRGIDAASVEQAQPTWVLLPLFETVRNAAQRAATALSQKKPLWRVPTLRATVHAGEDFSRLVEGLRRMHEAVEFGLVNLGDRIGHGVALGVDPERWAQAGAVIPQTIEDRLDDLLWEFARYSDGSFDCTSARLAFVRAELERLGRKLFGDDGVRPEALLELRKQLHCPAVLRSVGYPGPIVDSTGSNVDKRLGLFLSDSFIYERGQQIEEVRITEAEVTMLKAAQRFMTRELGRKEITIESNPTSNLLIGGYRDVSELPAFRLAPLSKTQVSGAPPLNQDFGSEEDSLLVSINADDPVSFASCLADEYAQIYYALLRQGVCSSRALRWLDQARLVGWRSRFTVAASTNDDVLQELIDEGSPTV